MVTPTDRKHETDDPNPDAEPETAAAEAPTTGAAEPDPAALLEAARAEAAAFKDQLLRALAEMENVRRRAQRDRDDAAKYGVSVFAQDLLAVADNLRRALEALPPEALEADEYLRNLAAGVELTERQLLAAFERHGIQRFEPVGEPFDSHRHQAMFEVPGSDQPAGTVVQLLQPGYMLYDRLLRPAMVGVAKGNSPGPGPNGAADDPPPSPGGRVDTVA
ncbi:MAG: nucleotide exchange factor GrpE [Dongiaceae bacterium]